MCRVKIPCTAGYNYKLFLLRLDKLVFGNTWRFHLVGDKSPLEWGSVAPSPCNERGAFHSDYSLTNVALCLSCYPKTINFIYVYCAKSLETILNRRTTPFNNCIRHQMESQLLDSYFLLSERQSQKLQYRNVGNKSSR